MYNFNKKNYYSNGYTIFKPYEILDKKKINDLNQFFDKAFLKYSDNHTYKSFNVKYTSESFENNNVVYNGFSENQIYFRGVVNKNKSFQNENILHGKRASIGLRNVDDKIVQIIEDERLINLAKYLMN